jgi:hypothetical protein
MRSTAQILASYKDAMKRRFLEVIGRRSVVPATVTVPTDPQAALELGMALGRKEGYGDGLKDGTALGLDVGLEAVDEILAQPVIFGTPGTA